MGAVLGGRSHAAVAEQYGISQVWVGKLMARWRTGGVQVNELQCRYPHQNGDAAPVKL